MSVKFCLQTILIRFTEVCSCQSVDQCMPYQLCDHIWMTLSKHCLEVVSVVAALQQTCGRSVTYRNTVCGHTTRALSVIIPPRVRAGILRACVSTASVCQVIDYLNFLCRVCHLADYVNRLHRYRAVTCALTCALTRLSPSASVWGAAGHSWGRSVCLVARWPVSRP